MTTYRLTDDAVDVLLLLDLLRIFFSLEVGFNCFQFFNWMFTSHSITAIPLLWTNLIGVIYHQMRMQFRHLKKYRLD